MMAFDPNIEHYPFMGSFYRTVKADKSVPLIERTDRDKLVLETKCDIQEVSKANNPTLIATFSVYFPHNTTTDLPVKRGMKFIGSMYGMDVSGLVTNVVGSELGGIVAYVKDYDT